MITNEILLYETITPNMLYKLCVWVLAVYGPHHARMLAHLAPKDVPITTHEYHMYTEVPTRPEC